MYCPCTGSGGTPCTSRLHGDHMRASAKGTPGCITVLLILAQEGDAHDVSALSRRKQLSLLAALPEASLADSSGPSTKPCGPDLRSRHGKSPHVATYMLGVYPRSCSPACTLGNALGRGDMGSAACSAQREAPALAPYPKFWLQRHRSFRHTALPLTTRLVLYQHQLHSHISLHF